MSKLSIEINSVFVKKTMVKVWFRVWLYKYIKFIIPKLTPQQHHHGLIEKLREQKKLSFFLSCEHVFTSLIQQQ